MEYIEQTYKSIFFYLTSISLEEGFFNIVSKQSTKHKNVDIEFGVLTESHFLKLSAGDETIAEICACKEYNFDNLKKLNIEAVPEDGYEKETAKFHYSFNSSVVDYRVGKKALAKLKEKQRAADTHYLTHTFPGRWTWSRPAITEIYVTIGDKIVTETVHTYPNESKMVFTRSEVIIK